MLKLIFFQLGPTNSVYLKRRKVRRNALEHTEIRSENQFRRQITEQIVRFDQCRSHIHTLTQHVQEKLEMRREKKYINSKINMAWHLPIQMLPVPINKKLENYT